MLIKSSSNDMDRTITLDQISLKDLVIFKKISNR